MLRGRSLRVVATLLIASLVGTAALGGALAVTPDGAVRADVTTQADSFEPNDDFGSAARITETNLTAEITGDESDFYEVQLNATDALDLRVNPDSAQVTVTLYDADRNQVASANNAFGNLNPLRITRHLPDGGTYYIEVETKDASATTGYTLEYDRITPPENDQFAPNDDVPSATTLPEGFNDAKIWGGESDFYEVQLNATEALDVEVDGQSAQLRLRLYDANRNRLASTANAFGNLNPLRITRHLPEPGTYYIEVKGKSAGTTTNYTLNYDRITPPENDQFAPNDDVPSATTLPEGFNDAKIWGGESDFYEVQLNATEALDVEVDGQSAQLRLRLYDADRNRLASTANAFGNLNPLRITRHLPEPGTYYIEVKGKSAGTTTNYTLNYDRITPPENDQFAPNDNFTTATTAPEGFNDAKIWGGESDFYRVQLNATEALDVEVDGQNAQLRLRLYDADRNRLASTANAFGNLNPLRITRHLADSGTYYVEVKGKSAGTTTSYTLNYDRITPPENDQFAPNDDFVSAAPITEEFNDAKIWGGESDFYRVELNASDGLRVEVSQQSAQLRLRLYDADRNRLASTANAFGNLNPLQLTQTVSEAGTYYIEVKGKGAGTTTGYTLQSNRTGASLVTGNATLRLEPANRTVTAGGNATYDLVLDAASAGVGVYDVTVTVSNASVARVVATADRTGASVTNGTVASDASSTRVRAVGGNTSDAGSVTLATLTLEGAAAGTTDVRITAATVADESQVPYALRGLSNASITVGSVRAPVVVPGNDPATDVDGDGKYEDVNGDRAFNVIDVSVLLTRFDDRPVRNNVGLFDFNDDGNVDILDVAALLGEV